MRDLNALAAESRLADRASQLRGLARALGAGGDRARWAGMDLYGAFLHEDTVAPPASPGGRWLGNLLYVAPQVLVFVPVGVTWFGLAAATNAYAHSLNDASAADSFLQGWQTGFHGRLSGWLRFDHIAFYTCTLIGLLLLVVFAHVLYDLTEDRRRGRLLRRLARVLTSAGFELATADSGAREQAAAELTTAMAECARVATDIQKVGDVARRTQKEAAAGLTAVADALTRIESGTTELSAAAGEIGTASQTIGQRLSDISTATRSVADNEAEFVRQITAGSDRVNDTLAQATGRLEKAVAANRRELTAALGDSSVKLSSAVGDSSAKLTAAVGDSSVKLTEALDSGADEVRLAFDDVRGTAAGYAARVEAAADVMGKAALTLESMPELAEQLRAGVEDLAARVAALSDGLRSAPTPAPQPAALPADGRLDRFLAAADRLGTSAEHLRVSVERLNTNVGNADRRGFFARLRPRGVV